MFHTNIIFYLLLTQYIQTNIPILTLFNGSSLQKEDGQVI